MTDSYLTVQIVGADNIEYNGDLINFEPGFIMAIENQRCDTKGIKEGDKCNPRWPDSTFRFQITTGKEDLKVVLVNKDVTDLDNVIGKCAIPLDILADQMKVEEEFDLISDAADLAGGGNGVIGSVHLILQWVYNSQKYFETALKRVDETLEQEKLQRKNVEQHLVTYRLPFLELLEQESVDADSEIAYDKLELDD